jgi:DNA-binding MarR family transcriptional regulator
MTLKFDPVQEARGQWEHRWGRAHGPIIAASLSIMRVQQILLAEVNAALSEFGLNIARYEALMLLAATRRGALPLGKMGERLQVHPTSVTNIINRLEEDGLARRIPHVHDRRTILAEITPTGRQLLGQATRSLLDERFSIAALTDTEAEEFTRLAAKIRIAAGDFELPDEEDLPAIANDGRRGRDPARRT